MGKAFDYGLFVETLCGVFELPLPRNAPKRTKHKSQGTKIARRVGGWVGGWVWDLANVRRDPSKKTPGLAGAIETNAAFSLPRNLRSIFVVEFVV